MLLRYVKLNEYIPQPDSVEIDALCLNVAENRPIEGITSQFDILESVTNRLKDPNTSASDVRDMFDVMMNDFRSTAQRLRPDADIKRSTNFEFSIVKVQLGNERSLTRAEKGALRSLESAGFAEGSTDVSISYAEKAIQAQKELVAIDGRLYVCTGFLLPTSNIFERLF